MMRQRHFLERYVAIKVPRADRLTDASARAFVEEARTIAKLEHPRIVPIYEAGHDEAGRVHIVMKWIEGCTLGQHFKKKKLRLFLFPLLLMY